MVAFQFFSLHVLALPILCVGIIMAASNETDKLALLAIKAQITDDPFGVTSSWNDSLPFCQWNGILCGHTHQRVTVLDLNLQNLKGHISPSIGNLSFLRIVDLSNNSFRGELPQQISHLFRLRALVLSQNSFEGRIPTNLSRLSKLRVLQLSQNNFSGQIPFQLSYLSELRQLTLQRNILEGLIPPHLGNLSMLKQLSIADNKLKGEIPATLGQLANLTLLDVVSNRLSGTIPKSIYNLSRLSAFLIADNKLQGHFPPTIGLTLPNIQKFRIWENQFDGPIPVSFSNWSNLLEFDITRNRFFGGIPDIFRYMRNLSWLGMSYTDLGSGGVSDMNFFASLTNCSNLRSLQFVNSNIGGEFPSNIGNLSTQLEFLSIAQNQISGRIPASFGNLISLNKVAMSENKLTGSIPTTFGKLCNLQELGLVSNQLSGEIPSSFGNLTLLSKLWLNGNNFNGSIPPTLGNCRSLLVLQLEDNNLKGTIPRDFIALPFMLISLTLSGNHLIGTLPPEVGNLKSLVGLDVSHNKLSGNITSSLGDCTSLRGLYMGNNIFEGTIPESLSLLRGIEELDLSHNNLSGRIPKDFATLVFLSMLNLSFNDLDDEVPIGGVFNNVTAISVLGNDKLCGGIPELHLQACFKKDHSGNNLSLTSKVIISVLCGLLGVCLLLCVLITFWFKNNRKGPSQPLSSDPFVNIAYGELLKATNGFSPDNLIGAGSFGSVYKGILETQETPIAVKVFNLERRGASKSFMAECETLRKIRHRNLLKVITACSSIDYQGNEFKALVYEFMPNGSLEDWLHPLPHTGSENTESLSLSQRLNIVIDVGSALDYLHNDNESAIIHCDLKPSNILLDHDMTAHVGDFGLSRILSEDIDEISRNHSSSFGIKGTIGYAAPEYGTGSKFSTNGDVYSFGILLLEIITGKRPTNGSFGGELNLNQFVKTALLHKVVEIVDIGLIPQRGEETASSSNTLVQGRSRKIDELLSSLLRIGVMCSEESPNARMQIKNALKELHAIKNTFLEDGRINYRASNL